MFIQYSFGAAGQSRGVEIHGASGCLIQPSLNLERVISLADRAIGRYRNIEVRPQRPGLSEPVTKRSAGCYSNVESRNEGVVEMSLNDARLDLETIFRAQYARIARVIAGVIRDPARAEELAVEVFLKWERAP
jgi:hypothetical protein